MRTANVIINEVMFCEFYVDSFGKATSKNLRNSVHSRCRVHYVTLGRDDHRDGMGWLECRPGLIYLWRMVEYKCYTCISQLELTGIGCSTKLDFFACRMYKVYLGSMCTAVLSGWDPATSPFPAFGLIYEGAMVSQDRRHLFLTP